MHRIRITWIEASMQALNTEQEIQTHLSIQLYLLIFMVCRNQLSRNDLFTWTSFNWYRNQLSSWHNVSGKSQILSYQARRMCLFWRREIIYKRNFVHSTSVQKFLFYFYPLSHKHTPNALYLNQARSTRSLLIWISFCP